MTKFQQQKSKFFSEFFFTFLLIDGRIRILHRSGSEPQNNDGSGSGSTTLATWGPVTLNAFFSNISCPRHGGILPSAVTRSRREKPADWLISDQKHVGEHYLLQVLLGSPVSRGREPHGGAPLLQHRDLHMVKDRASHLRNNSGFHILVTKKIHAWNHMDQDGKEHHTSLLSLA